MTRSKQYYYIFEFRDDFKDAIKFIKRHCYREKSVLKADDNGNLFFPNVVKTQTAPKLFYGIYIVINREKTACLYTEKEIKENTEWLIIDESDGY